MTEQGASSGQVAMGRERVTEIGRKEYGAGKSTGKTGPNQSGQVMVGGLNCQGVKETRSSSSVGGSGLEASHKS